MNPATLHASNPVETLELEAIMSAMIILLVLVIGGIAIWAWVRFAKDGHKSALRARSRSRPAVIAQSPDDPWGANRRRGERDLPPPGQRAR